MGVTARAARARGRAEAAIATYQVKATGVDQIVSALSGGNRQKVAFAKWLANDPVALILDEPTHGVDIGSKAQIHEIIAATRRPRPRHHSDLVGSAGSAGDERPHPGGRRRARSSPRFAREDATQERVMAAATRRGDGGACPLTPMPDEPPSPRRRIGEIALRLRVSGVVAFLVLLGALFSALTPQFLTVQNLTIIASNASILAIVAAAQAMVLLTRNLDVSVGSIMGLVGLSDRRLRRPSSRAPASRSC